MKLNFALPSENLRQNFRSYYLFETEQECVQPLCAELANIRFVLNGGGSIRFRDGREADISSSFVIGPTSSAYEVQMKPNTRIFGASIRANGWQNIFGDDAARHADQVFALSSIFGGLAEHWDVSIKQQKTLSEMAIVADELFRRHIDDRPEIAGRYSDAIEQWLRESRDLEIDDLTAVLGLSRRQTDRVALRYFGSSPKMLQRKYRALRAADRLFSGVTPWRSAAGPAYYDQSHFIKEFRRFIGVTPHAFSNKEAELIASIVSGRQQFEQSAQVLSGV